MQGGKVSAKDLAKVVWRLRAIPAQAVEDFRCHRRHREMPTSVLRRFIEQQRLLWSNRIGGVRSEEHTSELQSLMRISYAVFCLKKKNNITQIIQLRHQQS